jgi:Tfp pilus assembly protein PilO
MKKGKPLPKEALLGLIAVGILFVGIVGYMAVIKPQQSKVKEIDAQILDDETKLDQYAAEAAVANQTKAPKIRIADVYRLARAMPSEADMPDVVIELSDLAKASGIELTGIQPQPPTDGNGFKTVPIKLQFTSDFYRTNDFLFRLRTLVSVRHGQLEATGRLYSLQDVSMTPKGPQSIDVSATAIAYIYGGTPAATPSVPVPESTTTTSTDSSASAEGAP